MVTLKRTPLFNRLLDMVAAAAPTAAPEASMVALSRHFGRPVTMLRPGILQASGSLHNGLGCDELPKHCLLH